MGDFRGIYLISSYRLMLFICIEISSAKHLGSAGKSRQQKLFKALFQQEAVNFTFHEEFQGVPTI